MELDLETFESCQRNAIEWINKPRFDLEAFCFKEQLKFIQDSSRFKTAVCSRRAGKTIACAAHLIHEATNKPNRVCLYITLSRLNAKRIIWTELTAINQRFSLGGEPNESELSIRFPNNSIIYLSGAKDKSEIEKFRGLAITLCYVDEVGSFRAYIQELIDDVLGPALMDYAGTLALIGTPGPVPSGYFHSCSTGDSSWSNHAWTFWQNPFIAQKSGCTHQELLDRELKRRGISIDDPSIQREWFGKWTLDSNALVFRYGIGNDYRTLPEPLNWDYVIGVDLGYHDSDAIAVLGWNQTEKRVYLVEETITAKQGISALVTQISKAYETYKPIKIVMDTGGLGKKIAEEIQSRYSIPISAAEKTRKFEYIELLNDAMRSNRFFAKKESRFAQDCSLVQWDQDSDKPKISDQYHSDICDSVLYSFRESLHWLSEAEPIRPKPGMPEWMKEQERILEEFAQKSIQIQNEGDIWGDVRSN